MLEKHKVVKKYIKKKEKNRKQITKKKRANEQRDGVIRCESPTFKLQESHCSLPSEMEESHARLMQKNLEEPS